MPRSEAEQVNAATEARTVIRSEKSVNSISSALQLRYPSGPEEHPPPSEGYHAYRECCCRVCDEIVATDDVAGKHPIECSSPLQG